MGITLEIPQPANRSVLVEYTDRLKPDADWQALPLAGNQLHFPADERMHEISDPAIPGQSRYYRVLLMAP